MASGKRDPEPGDLIEIKRGVYQHWALYLGDGYVIHVTAEDEGFPPLSAGSVTTSTKKAKVKKQLLKDVVGTDDWKVNNECDQFHTPLPVKEIIKRAELYIDGEMPYDTICEHFVTMLRYGEEDSSQAGRGRLLTIATLKVASVAAASVGAVALTASGVGPVAAVGLMLGAATTSGVVAFLSSSKFSGRHSGNKRKSK